MTRINTNVNSLVAQKTLARSNDQLQQALTRLSTGLRINVGKDDPAGLIASEVLRSDIAGVQKAITNNQRADQLIATADSALDQVSALLNDIRGLISEAANTGALSTEQINANQLQVDSSLESIDRIARITTFQGRRLLDGSLDFLRTSPGTVAGAATSVVDTKVRASAVISGGAANTDIRVTAVTAGTSGNITVKIVDNSTLTAGSEQVSVVDGELFIQVRSGSSTAAQVIAAINGQVGAQFSAAAVGTVTGAVLGSVTSGVIANGVLRASAGSANSIQLTALSQGTSSNVTVQIVDGGTAGSETVSLAAGVLTITVASGTSTANQIISAINAQSTAFSATLLSGVGTAAITSGNYQTSAGTNSSNARNFALTSGQIGGITVGAKNTGPGFNDVTVRFTSGGSAGSETVTYDSTNKILTVQLEDGVSTATQIASAINAQSSLFSATLTSGTQTGGILSASSAAGTTSGGYSEAKLENVNINSVNFGTLTAVGVQVDVDVQATQGTLTYSGTALLAPVTLRIAGTKGAEVRSFGAGSTLDSIATAVNLVSDSTGVTASVVSGGTTNNLVFTSSDYGSAAYVQVEAINGSDFDTYNANGVAATRTSGTDVRARINGVQAVANGLVAAITTSTLDLSFTVNSRLVDGDSVTFTITGGGANFQIGPDVVSNQQARLGITSVSTTTLGGTNGTLFELRTGQTKSLSNDPNAAALVIDDAITQVTSLRGRLGAFQKTTLETNSFTLNDTLENLTAAESSIRDADFAQESARLTRAQILVQSGTQVLQIANSTPQSVLALLRG